MFQPTIRLYQNAYSGLSASTWWLSLVMLINRSGTMVVPFMTMYMTQHMGVGIGKAGLVMSFFGAGSILGALMGGKITDKIGSYYVQIFALTVGGILFFVLGQMQSFSSICAASFFLSMVNEAFRPANAVAIAQYSKVENRTRSYSLNRLAVNLGWAVGGAFGGLIASVNYKLLFWVDGCTNLLAAVLLFVVLSPSKNKNKLSVEAVVTETAKSVYKDYRYLFFILLQIFFAICFFQMFSMLPVFYKTQLHLSESFIGMNMAFNGLLIALFEMVLVFRLDGKKPNLFYISIGVLLVGVSFVILTFSFASAVVIALSAMFIISIGEMLSMPFMNSYWIARTNNSNRGQYAALYTVSWSIAQVIGPVMGGIIAEQKGFAVLWWMVGACCLLLSIAYKLLQNN